MPPNVDNCFTYLPFVLLINVIKDKLILMLKYMDIHITVWVNYRVNYQSKSLIYNNMSKLQEKFKMENEKTIEFPSPTYGKSLLM